MSYWDNIFGTSNEARSISREGVHFFKYDHPTDGFNVDFESDHLAPRKAFRNCGTLRTVVTRNAQAMANGRWYILDGKDMQASDVSARFPRVVQLLDNPNPKQEWAELVSQCEVIRQLFGSVFIYASAPEGMGLDRTNALWALRPDMVAYIDDDTAEIRLRGKKMRVPRETICEVKDTGSEVEPFIDQHGIYGDDDHNTRTHAARFAIKNIIQAEQSIYEINRDRGALGAWVDDSREASARVAMKPYEVKSLLERFREYGINRDRYKQMVINRPMRWQPISMSVRDLMLIEGMAENIKTICNTFDYPMELLVSDSKYSNKEVAKGHYDDAVIPFSLIYAAKLGRLLLGGNAYFVIDFSHVPAMKVAEEQKSKVFYQKTIAVQKLYQDGVISREEARLEMGYEEQIEGETMYNDKSQNNGGTDGGANQEDQE